MTEKLVEALREIVNYPSREKDTLRVCVMRRIAEDALASHSPHEVQACDYERAMVDAFSTKPVWEAGCIQWVKNRARAIALERGGVKG